MERRAHDADLDDALLKLLDQLIRVGIVNLEMNLAVFPMKRLHPRAEQDAAGRRDRPDGKRSLEALVELINLAHGISRHIQKLLRAPREQTPRLRELDILRAAFEAGQRAPFPAASSDAITAAVSCAASWQLP